jgi:NADH:ubiquinone oxidoreductase subunit 4 (subunit M)
MSLFLMTLAILAALMLWHDWKSGHVYAPIRRKHHPFEYDAPEHFVTKENSPVYYWAVILIVSVCCLIVFVQAILLFFMTIPILEIVSVPVIYLLLGLMGRGFSWVKNHGSIDKKW